MIYLQNENAKQFHIANTAIALGKFDGIHVGHQLLIDGLIQEKSNGKNALVFTFGSSPADVLFDDVKKYIYSQEEKAYYFSKLQVDVLLEYPFTKEFAGITPKDFVEQCLVKQLGVRSIYVGEDFRFGNKRSGDVNVLKLLGEEYGFEVHAIPKKTQHGNVVSSTVIRKMLEDDFSIANQMLGNPYFVYGKVVHGNHLGNTIGFPTINQEIPELKLVPAYGVYASKVCIDKKEYYAISNLGKKPTIEGNQKLGLETHILDFDGDLYGENLQVELLFFIRPEQKFTNVDELKEQIHKDIKEMQNMLSRKNA